MTSTVIKYSLGDDIRRTTVPAGELTFAGLFGKIAAAFPGAAPGDRKRIVVRYLDDEDEKCTISDDAELAEFQRELDWASARKSEAGFDTGDQAFSMRKDQIQIQPLILHMREGPIPVRSWCSRTCGW